MDMNQAIIEQRKDDTPRTTEIIDKFTNNEGQVNVTQLASNLAQKEREKSFLLKVIGGASTFVIIAIALMIVSVVIGTAIMRDTKVKNGVLVSNKGPGVPIQIEPTNYTFYFSVYDDEETIAKVKTVRIPILSGEYSGMLSFDVHEYLFIPKTKIVLSGLRYSLEINRYGHHVMINDPNVNPYEVSEVPSTNFERAVEENRIVKASYSRSIQNRNVNSLERRFNRSPAQLRRDMRSLRERGVEAEEEQKEENNTEGELHDFVARHMQGEEENGNDYPVGVGVHNYATGAGGSGDLINHGGPIMKTANLYAIYYGKPDAAYVTTVNKFLSDFTATPAMTSPNNPLYIAGYTGSAFKGSYTISGYTYGNSLTDSKIASIVSSTITSGKFGGVKTADPNGIYLFLTDPTVTASSGFCSKYCGWHSYYSSFSSKFKFSFVGDPRRCPNSCADVQYLTGGSALNATTGAQAAISIIAHEIVEAITDPQLNAWYDAAGYENADKCAWRFNNAGSPVEPDPVFNTTPYHVQMNYHNSLHGCVSMTYK